jgi:hypothetical protein
MKKNQSGPLGPSRALSNRTLWAFQHGSRRSPEPCQNRTPRLLLPRENAHHNFESRSPENVSPFPSPRPPLGMQFFHFVGQWVGPKLRLDGDGGPSPTRTRCAVPRTCPRRSALCSGSGATACADRSNSLSFLFQCSHDVFCLAERVRLCDRSIRMWMGQNVLIALDLSSFLLTYCMTNWCVKHLELWETF